MRYPFMRAGLPLLALAICAVFALQGCGESALRGPEAKPPTGLEPAIEPDSAATWPVTDPNSDPAAPSLDMMITKSMLYAAGLKHGVNPYLVMGLAWHESGWRPAVVSSAGAVGIMQVMPSTAAADGPALLHRAVNLFDPGDNIDIGVAILKPNLDGRGLAAPTSHRQPSHRTPQTLRRSRQPSRAAGPSPARLHLGRASRAPRNRRGELLSTWLRESRRAVRVPRAHARVRLCGRCAGGPGRSGARSRSCLPHGCQRPQS